MSLLNRVAFALAAVFVFGAFGSVAEACHHRATCCCEPEPAPVVCCKPTPPPMVNQVLCLVDPCTGCTKEVEVCIPATCCAEVPTIDCRRGIFKRKIYTVSWKCCDFCLEVVWTKFGRIKVRY